MQNVKMFFRQCRNEIRELHILSERREYLRMKLLPAAIRYKQVDVQTSGSGDPLLETVPEILEIERELQNQIHKLIVHQMQAYQMIEMLPDTKQRQVMMLYYLDDRLLTWQQVAEEVGYAERSVLKLHGEALKLCK